MSADYLRQTLGRITSAAVEAAELRDSLAAGMPGHKQSERLASKLRTLALAAGDIDETVGDAQRVVGFRTDTRGDGE